MGESLLLFRLNSEQPNCLFETGALHGDSDIATRSAAVALTWVHMLAHTVPSSPLLGKSGFECAIAPAARLALGQFGGC